MEFTKTASPATLNSVIGWWHSHHNFEPFWSQDDSKTFNNLVDLSNSCFGVVVAFPKDGSNKLLIRSRYDFYTKGNVYMSIDDINVEVEASKRDFKINSKTVQAEIEDKVVEDAREWRQCAMCQGTGVVSTPKPRSVPTPDETYCGYNEFDIDEYPDYNKEFKRKSSIWDYFG
jgi:hypothetical protein